MADRPVLGKRRRAVGIFELKWNADADGAQASVRSAGGEVSNILTTDGNRYWVTLKQQSNRRTQIRAVADESLSEEKVILWLFFERILLALLKRRKRRAPERGLQAALTFGRLYQTETWSIRRRPCRSRQISEW